MTVPRDAAAPQTQSKGTSQESLPLLTNADPPSDAIYVDDAMEAVGLGPFQRQLLLLCGLGVAGDAMAKAAMMYILQGASKQWSLKGGGLGLLPACGGLGQVRQSTPPLHGPPL